MKRQFVKMHGIGNDYIYFDCLEQPFKTPSAAAVRLSDRHFSVGGDGIVLILPSKTADARMRMFNADGSEGEMCGNAVRCIAKYLYDIKGIKKKTLTIETKAGVKTISVRTKKHTGEAIAFSVDMGKPILTPLRIPALFTGKKIVSQPLIVGEETYRVTCLSMGNPHCVVFGGDPDALDLVAIGPLFESHPAFPERTNTEFVEVLARNELKMRVWERGSGETLACGTGACAAAVASVLNGYCDGNSEIVVHLRGGDLTVNAKGRSVLMTGPAEIAFTGEVDL